MSINTLTYLLTYLKGRGITSLEGSQARKVTGLGFKVRVRVYRVSACCDCLTESPLSCDNVHLIVTLDVNVGPVTTRTSDPSDL